MVASRAPWRPRLAAASWSRSTSIGVRYSRLREAAFGRLRGGAVLVIAGDFPENGGWRSLPVGPQTLVVAACPAGDFPENGSSRESPYFYWEVFIGTATV